jgi:hypothetical protein
MIWCVVWHGMAWYDMRWCEVWYGMVWHVWFGMVWLGVICYTKLCGMAWCHVM